MIHEVLETASGSSAGRTAAGVLLAVGSAALYDLGYVLEKQALETLPPVRPHPVSVLRVGLSSSRWMVGFVAMVAALGLQVIALSLAPVSVVQPILAGGLVAMAAVGNAVLGERLHRRQVVALVVVLLAVVAVALSAKGGEVVARHVDVGGLVALGLPVAAAAVLLAGWGIRTHHGERPLLAVAVGAGLFYGLGAIAEKAISTRLIDRGVVDGFMASLGTSYPWLFVVTTAAGMLVFQVGLQRHPASMMATFTNVTSGACALVGATVAFGESLLPGGWWSVARLAGFAGLIAALVVMITTGPGARLGSGEAVLNQP